MKNINVPFTGAIDSLSTGLESAWSVGRRLRTGYIGNIIRVRRSSDNNEQDFGYLTNGSVDVAAVVTFCGAGDGFLTTIYDQSGLGRNLIQTSSAVQPLVVSSGVANTKNGKLTAVFNTNPYMTVPSSGSVYKFLHDGTSSTICSVQEVSDTASVKGFLGTYLSAANAGTRINMSATEGVSVLVSISVVQAVKTSEVLTYNAMTVLLDADNPVAADRESVWLDGSSVELTPSNAFTNSPSFADSIDLAVGYNWLNYFTGSICELIIWSQDISANRAVWQSNAKTFWGTP